MLLKMPTIAVIFLAAIVVSDCSRIRVHEVEEREELVMQAQFAARNDEEGNHKAAFKHRATIAADGAEGDSAGTALQSPAAILQAVFSHGTVFSPALNVSVRRQLDVGSNEPPSSFSKLLEHIKTANWYSRILILRAACDSSAFSCKEIIKLANNCRPRLGPYRWHQIVMPFAKGRKKRGCISDPANSMSIVDEFESRWPDAWMDHSRLLGRLEQAFVVNDHLLPAKSVGPPPAQLQTGLRTDEDMEKLLGDMAGLQLIRAHGYGTQGLGHSPRMQEFQSWLKQIRSLGEQFSGPQLVTLIDAIPESSGTAHAVSAMLQYLEQYVTGVTCTEVKQIMCRMIRGGESFLAGLDALKSSIVDGQNKVDILAFTDLIYPFLPREIIINQAAMVLKDVGVGLPPRNNPIFGLVRGNPVIVVVDESTSMDAKFTLGNPTFTLRKFCYHQLERVFKGLPKGTYFNVIQYSSSAVKIFPKTVLVTKTSIDAAMDAIGTIWRGSYTPGQNPVEMLRNMRAFALRFKHRVSRSTKRNSMDALRLAYATADLPSQLTDEGLHTLHDHGAPAVTKGSPQIYFLTSGQPDGEARQILDNIDVFDDGRNIPVNAIAFPMPADPVAKQFAKDLAHKTGGFFRSIEQPSLYTKKRRRSPTSVRYEPITERS